MTEDDLTKQRLSDLLISDKLIHEENTKVIAELQESNLLKDAEISKLKAALEQANKLNVDHEQKLKAQTGQITTMKHEAKEIRQELNKKSNMTECLQ